MQELMNYEMFEVSGGGWEIIPCIASRMFFPKIGLPWTECIL